MLSQEKLNIDTQGIYEYKEFPNEWKRILAKAGITQEVLKERESPHREFSEELIALYEQLKKLVVKEWEEYRTDPLNDKLLYRYLSAKTRNKTVFNKPVSLDEVAEKQVEEYKDEAEAYKELELMRKQLSISSGLSSFDAMRCAEDRTRTLLFFETIKEKIQPGDQVLEAGAGTGILAIAAAKAGAEKVEAIEINPVTAVFARRVIKRCEEMGIIKKGQVKIRLGDALKYDKKDKKKFDAYISENIYTGQFYELQIQLNNHLLKFVDEKKDKIIPIGMISAMEFVELPSDIIDKTRNKTDFVAQDLYNPMSSNNISEPEIYDYIDFNKEEAVGFRHRLVRTVAENGRIDGITVFSLIQLSEKFGNFIRRQETEFLNNDHVVMLTQPVKVHKGDKVEVYISYKGGDRPGQAEIRVKNLRTGQETENRKERIKEAA